MGWYVVPFTVMIADASLPIFGNVFTFSRRYEVAEELMTPGMAVPTVSGW